MAKINTSSGSRGSIIEHGFTDLKLHDYSSKTILNHLFLKIVRNDKNEITKIILPWTFYLDDENVTVYSVRHFTELEIDESFEKVTIDQLKNSLIFSYKKLYDDVVEDVLLQNALNSIQDFSPKSYQAQENINAALNLMSKIVFP